MTEEVRAYYAGFGAREWDRLESMADGRVEFAVTCDALARYLLPQVRVLDIGGGPGLVGPAMVRFVAVSLTTSSTGPSPRGPGARVLCRTRGGHGLRP
jgi:hypothetical protein